MRDVATLPVDELPVNTYDELRSLKPEESLNFSVGAAVRWNKLGLTLEYYRIALRAPVNWRPEDKAGNPVANPNNYYAVKWFSNDFDTMTQGVDAVANYPVLYGTGQTTLTLALNVNHTSVTEENKTSLCTRSISWRSIAEEPGDPRRDASSGFLDFDVAPDTLLRRFY